MESRIYVAPRLERPRRTTFAGEEGEMAEFDTIIRGGMIIDGTRLPRFRDDIAIKDGRSAKIGRLKNHEAATVIDAGGLIVAPGFVGLDTHYNLHLFLCPHFISSGFHGTHCVVCR